MSMRLKIARWLAPEVWRDLNEDLLRARRRTAHLALDNGELCIALRNISALRTPKCAHIGKRMADIADAALKEGAK